jgi:hypothetical protein
MLYFFFKGALVLAGRVGYNLYCRKNNGIYGI